MLLQHFSASSSDFCHSDARVSVLHVCNKYKHVCSISLLLCEISESLMLGSLFPTFATSTASGLLSACLVFKLQAVKLSCSPLREQCAELSLCVLLFIGFALCTAYVCFSPVLVSKHAPAAFLCFWK